MYKAPTDAEGYAYSLAICGEIPKASLPSGCQQYAEHPSVVKYKGDNPADCIEIGSIGPCSQGECGMTGAPGAGGGVVVTYTYTYGCKNTFTLTMTSGSDPAPGQVTSNECSYTATWAANIGGGGTWVITWPVIIIVIVAAAALGGGTGYNIKKRNMQGAEAVPFIGFWRALPGLVKDGAMFSYTHGREFALMVGARPNPRARARAPSLTASARTGYRQGDEEAVHARRRLRPVADVDEPRDCADQRGRGGKHRPPAALREG